MTPAQDGRLTGRALWTVFAALIAGATPDERLLVAAARQP